MPARQPQTYPRRPPGLIQTAVPPDFLASHQSRGVAFRAAVESDGDLCQRRLKIDPLATAEN